MLDRGTRLHSGDEINRSTATGSINVQSPLTGTTIALGTDDRLLYVNPAGTIAALTVKLTPNPQPYQICELSFGQIVTALTVQDWHGSAVATTAGAIGVAIQYRFINGAWVKWR
jgi:hypothetical protein